ncbi:SemiSWEET family sugar transporter [Chloroflexota bacterium]
MTAADIVGQIAGVLVTLSLVPQVIRVYKLKSAREISMLFTTMLWFGLFAWIAYGFLRSDLTIIIWNIIGACITTLLLYAKFRYGRG